MGQQQIMLIVLGVMIAGVAVLVGIQMFSASVEQDNINQTSVEMLRLVDKAHEYYAKPKVIGGGGKAFTGFSIPARADTTENAYYSVVTISSQRMSLLATCRTADDATITAIVYPTTHRLIIDRTLRTRLGC